MKAARQTLYLVNAALASGALSYAVRLSSGDRGALDWIVMTLIVGCLVYNLVRLGQRLHAAEGAKAVWHLQRTLLFWIVGLLNTVWARPEHEGGWRTWVGGAFLVVALADSVVLLARERRALAPDSLDGGVTKGGVTKGGVTNGGVTKGGVTNGDTTNGDATT